MTVLLVLATGGGKTIIFSWIVSEIIKREKRVVIVAHRIELVDQICLALDALGLPYGRIAPGYTQTDDLIQVAMVQTLKRRIEKGLIDPPDVVVYDEAHHVAAAAWDYICKAWKTSRMLGVTATPARLDGRGLSHVFGTMVLGPTTRELIDGGFLADYEYYAPPSAIDLSGVKITEKGDYNLGDLERALEASTIVGDAVEHYRKRLNGRPTIAFCVTRSHCRQVAERFRDAGWRAEVIDGTMSKALRADLIAGLADGRIQVLCSCDLISEGVDVPVVAGAILLRPTESLALFLQQIGRILRLKPDGSRAVVLDHVGNVHKFGMPDADRDWTLEGKSKRPGDEGITTCTLCFKAFPAREARRRTLTCPGVDGETCPLQAGSDERDTGRGPPRVVDGELEQVTDIKPPGRRPGWANGLSLAKEDTKGRAWFDLLDLAGYDKAKLREIAEARGYKKGWVYHYLDKIADLDAEIDEILTSEPYVDDSTWTSASNDVLYRLVRLIDSAERAGTPIPSHWTIARDFAKIEVWDRKTGGTSA